MIAYRSPVPRRPTRFRRTRALAWAASLALLAVIVPSKWYTASCHATLASRAVYAAFSGGGVSVTIIRNSAVETGWSLSRGKAAGPLWWWPVYDHSGGVRATFTPLWMPATLAAAGALGLTWLGRRPPAGHCPCGYSLAGIAPRTPCPECGTMTP